MATEEEHILDMASGDYKNNLLLLAKYKAFVDAAQPLLVKDEDGHNLLEQKTALEKELDEERKKNAALLQSIAAMKGSEKNADTGHAKKRAIRPKHAGNTGHSKPRA